MLLASRLSLLFEQEKKNDGKEIHVLEELNNRND